MLRQGCWEKAKEGTEAADGGGEQKQEGGGDKSNLFTLVLFTHIANPGCLNDWSLRVPDAKLL